MTETKAIYDRITSYNVCYTKLLRFALVGVTPKKLQDYAWFVERIPRNASVLELQPVEVPKLSAIGVEQILAQHPSVVREEQSVIREYVVKLEQQQRNNFV